LGGPSLFIPPDALEKLAVIYVDELGDYFNQTSIDALTEGFSAQLNSGWSNDISWRRSTPAYGLDSKQTRSYIITLTEQAKGKYDPQPIPEKSAAAIDKLMLDRADRIGSNEAYKATQMGRNTVWQYMEQHGDIHGAKKRWITAQDELVCSVCASLDRQERSLRDPFETPTGEKIHAPGAHPNCFPSGTLVSGPATVAATTRWYEGEMVRITTASGRVLSVTPNHPLLTSDGWLPAGLVANGANLVAYSDLEQMSSDGPDDDKVPSLIEDVASSLLVSSEMYSASVPVSPKDFHGDGSYGYVNVVGAASLLLDRIEVSEPSGDQGLLRSRTDSVYLSGGGSLHPVLKALAFAPDGVVSRFGERATLLRAGIGHSNVHGFRPASLDDASIVESAVDSSTTDALLFREALDALPREVSLDKAVDVIRYPFSGHVFNLETVEGWYIANDIIVHNCRCEIVLNMGMNVIKNMPGDPFDRDHHGRFANREERKGNPVGAETRLPPIGSYHAPIGDSGSPIGAMTGPIGWARGPIGTTLPPIGTRTAVASELPPIGLAPAELKPTALIDRPKIGQAKNQNKSLNPSKIRSANTAQVSTESSIVNPNSTGIDSNSDIDHAVQMHQRPMVLGGSSVIAMSPEFDSWVSHDAEGKFILFDGSESLGFVGDPKTGLSGLNSSGAFSAAFDQEMSYLLPSASSADLPYDNTYGSKGKVVSSVQGSAAIEHKVPIVVYVFESGWKGSLINEAHDDQPGMGSPIGWYEVTRVHSIPADTIKNQRRAFPESVLDMIENGINAGGFTHVANASDLTSDVIYVYLKPSASRPPPDQILKRAPRLILRRK
jgi:hypothetical protein